MSFVAKSCATAGGYVVAGEEKSSFERRIWAHDCPIFAVIRSTRMNIACINSIVVPIVSCRAVGMRRESIATE
jgi:hypothetical protein